MDIKVSVSWLREFLHTEADTRTLATVLTQCGPTVDRQEQRGEDTVFQLEVTPNRLDLVSVVGLAREAAAILHNNGIPASFSWKPKLFSTGRGSPAPVTITCSNGSLMPFAVAEVYENVSNRPSPEWMKERLEKAGIRSLGSLVDISNYVMLETGQPLHIFDLDRIGNSTLQFRESREGERITPLDGLERHIPTGSIVVEDGTGVLIDLCGVMGGENSGVTENTSRVLILTAIYDPIRIRHTFRTLNFATEAALRFEKILDSEMVSVAAARAGELMHELTGGVPVGNPLTVGKSSYHPHTVTCSQSLIETYLDQRVDLSECVQLLEPLGLNPVIDESSLSIPTITVTVPSHRAADITIPEDIVEEIARMKGFHALPSILPKGALPKSGTEPQFARERSLEDAILALGYTETYHYSFVNELRAQALEPDMAHMVRITNPLNSDLTMLRPSLLSSLLPTIAENQHRERTLRLFEHERVYHSSDGDLPHETFHLAAIYHSTVSDEAVAIYEMKLLWERISSTLHIHPHRITLEKTESSVYVAEQSALVCIDGTAVGVMGRIHPTLCKAFGITGICTALDLESEALLTFASTQRELAPVLEHPPLVEDMTFIVPEHYPAETLRRTITDLLSDAGEEFNCSLVSITTSYQNEVMKTEKRRALTVTLTYQGTHRTPSTEGVQNARSRIITVLESQNVSFR